MQKSILKITISALKTFMRVIKTHNFGSIPLTIKMAAKKHRVDGSEQCLILD